MSFKKGALFFCFPLCFKHQWESFKCVLSTPACGEIKMENWSAAGKGAQHSVLCTVIG